MRGKEEIFEQINKAKMARDNVTYSEIKLPSMVISEIKSASGDVVETEKQERGKKKPFSMKTKEETVKNGEKIIKHVEDAKNVKLERFLYQEFANHVADRVKVPLIYYIVMIFGLASAIFGAVKAIDLSIMLGGLCIFLAAFIGFLEIKISKNKFREI